MHNWSKDEFNHDVKAQSLILAIKKYKEALLVDVKTTLRFAKYYVKTIVSTDIKKEMKKHLIK